MVGELLTTINDRRTCCGAPYGLFDAALIAPASSTDANGSRAHSSRSSGAPESYKTRL